ncbi:PAS domain-containing sensor histidine kinase [Desertivirga arenae]|uniref:PAS domain-containing sensor histidine kinase n=1 Tax=Desertivirga arenae TaxID=2810309 RepID=UPI001A976044|nr:PAS domain S-box protein [Pedobacter sp. SYSU D00823]
MNTNTERKYLEEIQALKNEIKYLEASHRQALETVELNKSRVEDIYKGNMKFRAVFDQSVLGKKIIDSDLRIIKANKALIDILQYTEKELVGIDISELSHPDFKVRWEVLRNALWRNESRSFSIDTCIIKKDKTLIWCHITSIVFQDHGKKLGYTIIEDISERKQREETDKRLREKEFLETIIAQEREKEQVADGITNSLAQLLFATQMELSKVNSRNRKETDYLAIDQAGKLLHTSISECRLISQQLMPSILQDFGLKAAIESLCDETRWAIDFSCTIHFSNYKVHKYFDMIVFRLVQELLVNIMKHSQATTGSLSIKEIGYEMVIVIEDNGKGFILEEVQGAGTGLDRIRRNISLLKGNFELKSTPGKGAIAAVRLPLP